MRCVICLALGQVMALVRQLAVIIMAAAQRWMASWAKTDEADHADRRAEDHADRRAALCRPITMIGLDHCLLHDGRPVLEGDMLDELKDDFDTALLHYRMHGWTVLESGLPEWVLTDLHAHSVAMATLAHDMSDDDGCGRGHGRRSFNMFCSITDEPFMAAWRRLWADESDMRKLLTTISSDSCGDSDDIVSLDSICGGDSVAPAGHGQPWHSDWHGVHDACVAVSIVTAQHHGNSAPIGFVSKAAGSLSEMGHKEYNTTALAQFERYVNPPFGSILIRDVNCWHRGSSNVTEMQRVLPCLRFLTARCLRTIKYRPRRVMPLSTWQMLDAAEQRLTAYIALEEL